MFNKIYEKIKEFISLNWKFLLLLIFIILFFTIELPYIIYTPGGVISLEDRVKVEDGYVSDGELQMAYVSVVKGSTPFVLLSFIMPNWDLEKKEDVTQEGESINDKLERDRVYLEQSIDTAVIEAYELTNNEIELINEENKIVYISEYSDTNLKIGDDVLKFDGITFNNFDDFKDYIESKNIGDKIEFKVLRNGKEKDTYAIVKDIENEKKIGISITTTYDYKTNPEVVIESEATESGPSGGLMLALGIYDQLTKEDITKGKNIVGTGTIEEDGTVGEIGGVKYKLIGANKAKADIFICPLDNYEEALEVKKEKGYDIEIISASSLEDAINKLSVVK